MKLKNMIIDAEYNEAFPETQEFTDWVNCIDYEYNPEDNVPPALEVTEKTRIVLQKDNNANPGYYIGLDR
jgi:hypothetical protein